MPRHLALLSTLIGSNYPCLKLIFMIPKVFEPLKFDSTSENAREARKSMIKAYQLEIILIRIMTLYKILLMTTFISRYAVLRSLIYWLVQSTLVISKSKGPSETLRDIRTSTYQMCRIWGWSGGAKVLGKLLVPGRPTNLYDSRARACCACSRCGWGLFGHFYSHLSYLSSVSLSLGGGPI